MDGWRRAHILAILAEIDWYMDRLRDGRIDGVDAYREVITRTSEIGKGLDMYNDADIEMMELEAAGNEASHAHRKYEGNPISVEALQAVRDAAYHAAFYFCPVFEAVLEVCHEYEIDIEDARVQDAWWRGQVAGSEAE